MEETFALLNTPPAQWRGEVEKRWPNPCQTGSTLPATVQELDLLIERAVRLRAYLDYRHGVGFDQGHHKAVHNSNRLGAQIRRLLGYARMRFDLSF